MNKKRFAACVVVGFIFTAIYDYVVHGIMLTSIYEQTPELWRSPETMNEYIPFMNGMQFTITAVLTFIYTRHHEGKGIAEGLRFGIMFGLLMGLMQFSAYAWMPISITLASLWLISAMAYTMILGVLFSVIYKK